MIFWRVLALLVTLKEFADVGLKNSLWSVPNQGMGGVPSDTLALTRGIDGGLGLMFYGMYFPKKSWGFSGEIFFRTKTPGRCDDF